MGALPPEFFLIVVAVISAIVGGTLTWLIGYINRGWGEKEAQHRSLPAEEPSDSDASPADDSDAVPDAADVGVEEAIAAESEGQIEHELLRVSREEEKLSVFVQGQIRRRHLDEVTDSQARQEAIDALQAIMVFAEGWLPASEEPTQVPAFDEDAFLEQLRGENPLIAAGNAAEPASDLLPFVQEIEELVQRQLKSRPDLAEREIRITTDLRGNLRIYVGQQGFDSAADISDAEVRTLIQEAIREWERS